MTATGSAEAIERLVEVVDRLLDPDAGCVWNRAQTHKTLGRYVVEEAYELVDAIDAEDRDEIIEELGDVLYQVVLHAGIASHAGSFDLSDVARSVSMKMTSRHSHVFGDDRADTIAEVERLWAARKRAEKATRASRFDGVPTAMPPLERAVKLLERTGSSDSAETSRTAELPAGQRRVDADWGTGLLDEIRRAHEAGIDPVASLRAAVAAFEDAARAGESA
jgi:XTP/dITP diphosphohydrolase